MPQIKGQLLAMSVFPPEFDAKTGKQKKQKTSSVDLKYFVIDPVNGELATYRSEKEYASSKTAKGVLLKFSQILAIWGPSERSEMKKKKVVASVEISFYNESILLLGAYDKRQVEKWLSYLQRAKKFCDWLFSIKLMIEKSQNPDSNLKLDLTDAVVKKLNEIVEFCQNYSQVESISVSHISLKQAQQQAQLLQRHKLEELALSNAKLELEEEEILRSAKISKKKRVTKPEEKPAGKVEKSEEVLEFVEEKK